MPFPLRSGKRPAHRRLAFTLLEIVLALSLSAVLLGVLGLALSAVIRATQAGRRDVAQAQLARAVLHRIADDVRGTIWYEPLDASSMLGDAASSASSALSDEDTGSPATPTTPDGSTVGDAAASAAEGTGQVSDAAAVPVVPGLVGGAEWLEVDVSRLPRLNQNAWPTGGAALMNPSDVKTVAYSIGSQSGGDATGLTRRELDRSVTMWAAGSGTLSDWHAQVAEMLAPEVTALEFQYFDGTSWYSDWDSSQAGGLPLVVQISISLADPTGSRDDASFSLTVHLPMAQAASSSSSGSMESGEEPTADAAAEETTP